jgi:hypothetical protein
MPRLTTPLISEQADLHALVVRSMQDSDRELRRILRVAQFVEKRDESRRHSVLRVWAARAAVAMAMAAVIAVYVVMVLRLQMPISGNPFG